MKVLIVAPNFGTFGGCEAFVFHLANALLEQGLEVTICLKKVKGLFSPDGSMDLYVAETAATVVYVDRASKELLRWIKWADIVHGQNPSIDVAVMTKAMRKPLVMTIHGWLRDRWSPRSILSRIASWLADRRWFNSDFVWNKWEPGLRHPSSGKLPVVSCLPVGIIDPSERKGFVFAARWIENKGLEVLLEAYAASDLDRDAWPLVLLGSGPLRDSIERKIKDEQIRGIQVKGFVDDRTRSDIIRHARWMVTPPHTNEDLGLTPIEARHVAVPCIITRDGGLPEAAGRYALTCEPKNVTELRVLLEQAARMDEGSYRKLAEATYNELVEHLRPMSLYVEYYAEVLGRDCSQ